VDGRSSDNRALYLVLGLASVFFVLIAAVCGLGGLGAMWLSARDATPPPPPPALGPLDDGLTPVTTAPTTPGRDRYRPGPFVQVVGVLPTGHVDQPRMRRDGGRTVDTPWIVAGAELRSEAAPDATPAGGPSLAHGGAQSASQTLTVLAGTPARLGLRADAASDTNPVGGLIVAFHDYPGHFFLPASVDTELGHVRVAGVDDAEIHFGLDTAVRPDGSTITGAPFEVTMYLAAVDVAGRVSPYLTRRLSIQPVGTGDVEVTLTMTQPTDLDLYVTDPTGVTVYYGNDRAFSGGQLDLDANAACSSNLGVNNEHVFWPAGQSPPGTYTVRVANFESCIGAQPVDYRVTVQNCGETVVLAGRFEGPGDGQSCMSDPGSNRDWCQQVVEFEVTPCRGATAPTGAPAL
jgi:hypothetical protein